MSKIEERIGRTLSIEKVVEGFIVYQGHTGDRFVNKVWAFSKLSDALALVNLLLSDDKNDPT